VLRQFAGTTRPASRCRTTAEAMHCARKSTGLARGFVSSAAVDLEFHTPPASASRDVRAFERNELEKIGTARGNSLAAPAAAVRSNLFRRTLCGGLLQLHVKSGVMDAGRVRPH